jgi:hypothetical protein
MSPAPMIYPDRLSEHSRAGAFARILPAIGYVVLCTGFFYAWLRPNSDYAHYYVRNAGLMVWFELMLALLGVFLALKAGEIEGPKERMYALLGTLVIMAGFLFMPLWPLLTKDPAAVVPWAVLAVSHAVEAFYGGQDPKKQRRNAIVWFFVCWGIIFVVWLGISMPYLGLTPAVQSALWPQAQPGQQNVFAALVILFAVQAITAIAAARQPSFGLLGRRRKDASNKNDLPT